jgi:hypothetical protein
MITFRDIAELSDAEQQRLQKYVNHRLRIEMAAQRRRQRIRKAIDKVRYGNNHRQLQGRRL